MAILGTPIYIQNMTMAVGGHTGNVIIMPQMQVYACYISDLVVPSGVLLLTQPLGSIFLVCTPVTTEPPLVFSVSGQPQGLLLLSGICTSLFLQPCVTLQPLIQQPQAPKESEQAVADASEQQRKLEAAEALLALSNSSPAPTDPMPLAQPCNQSDLKKLKSASSTGQRSLKGMPDQRLQLLLLEIVYSSLLFLICSPGQPTPTSFLLAVYQSMQLGFIPL